jgi:hypothetical protein
MKLNIAGTENSMSAEIQKNMGKAEFLHMISIISSTRIGNHIMRI